MVDPVTGRTVRLLAKLLDGCAERHRILAANVANAETPGYRRVDLRFTDALRRALKSASPDAVSKASWQPEVDVKSPARADGNNVCLDIEMAEIAKNRLTYEIAVAALRRKIALVRSAITGRPY
jgi:flagellar basal-body rod protein FlgB